MSKSLSSAMATVRKAIFDLQAKIENETDPVKKTALIAEMNTMAGNIGFAFDGDVKGAEAQVAAAAEAEEETTTVAPAKASLIQKLKNGLFTAWDFLCDNKKVVIGSVVTVAAGAAAYAYTGGKFGSTTVPADVNAFSSGMAEMAGAPAAAAESVATSGWMDKAALMFSGVIGFIVTHLAIAKNWVVGLFSKPAVDAVAAAV